MKQQYIFHLDEDKVQAFQDKAKKDNLTYSYVVECCIEAYSKGLLDKLFKNRTELLGLPATTTAITNKRDQ